MKDVIGLVGFKGSGKDTAASMFAEHGYHQDSFAAPLKDAVAQIFSWDRAMVEGATPDSRAWRERPDPYWSKAFGYDLLPREVLQKFGTESMRNVFHDDIWVRSLMRRIETSSHSKFVISDVRFQNEVVAIRQLGGIVIRIRRGPEPPWMLIADAANRGHRDAMQIMTDYGIHRSEWDWIGTEFEYVIENDGTLEELRAQLDRIVERRTIHA